MPKVPKNLRWLVPLGADVTAEIKFHGGDVTPETLRTLRAHLAIAERALTGAAAAAAIEPENLEPVAAGDLVQIRPSADPVFGGLIFRVMKTAAHILRGYVLVPYRGGHAETWQTWKPSDVEKVGRVLRPEAEWGYSQQAAKQRRRMWIE